MISVPEAFVDAATGFDVHALGSALATGFVIPGKTGGVSFSFSGLADASPRYMRPDATRVIAVTRIRRFL
jgi:hypothetical protein